MNIGEFWQQLHAHANEVNHAVHRTLPVKVGRAAKDFYQAGFRKGGFTNGGFHPWQPTRRQQSGGKRAADNNGPLLSGHNHLFGSIYYAPGDARVKIYNPLRYAPIHNYGGWTDPAVTPRMRRYAWYRYYQETGQKKGEKRKKDVPEPEEAKRWKALALTPKQKLRIHIPQRQFMGESEELRQQIRDQVDKEITKIIAGKE